MPRQGEVAGRAYAPVYAVHGRGDVYAFLADAIRRSGGEVLYESDGNRAPLFFGIQGVGDERLGLLCYAFRCNPPPIKGRAPDEHRAQIRYGSEDSWHAEPHPVGRDIAGVDVTIVVGVHLAAGIIVGLDPLLYDPLPMGISVEFKDVEVQAAIAKGWHVWERETVRGRRRTARASDGLETLVAFRPERLLDYVRLERQASALGLDPPLRYRAAETVASKPLGLIEGARHVLEKEFELSGREILAIIAERARLSVAVRGGVAEHHLARHLDEDPAVRDAALIDKDGQPDFETLLEDGRRLLIECKNASPRGYADGSFKVEVQKTRASKGDPASRLYRSEQFDVVAACLYPATGRWEFRFRRTDALPKDTRFPDRIAPLQRIDGSWAPTLLGALGNS
jgi:hypothetical protein